MKDAGVERFRKAFDKMREQGNVFHDRSVGTIIDATTGELIGRIAKWQETLGAGRAGRNNAYAAMILDMDPAVLAYLTCRYMVNGLVLRRSLTAIKIEIGNAIEDEWRMQRVFEGNKDAFKWVTRELKRRKVQKRHHRREFYLQVAKHKGIAPAKWPIKVRVNIGATLVELFCRTTNLAKVVLERSGNRTIGKLKVSPSIYEWLEKSHGHSELMKPVHLPMVCTPRPWEGLWNGGYYTMDLPMVKNMEKKNRKEQEELLKKEDTTIIRNALNALDSTGFKVNQPVLAVLEKVWEQGLTIGKLPPRESLPVPPKPHDIATNKEARKSWSKMARNIHEANDRLDSTRLSVMRVIETAHRFKDEQAIYFPHQLDFRGRVYEIPTDLNPQGPDFSRALLHFAEGKYIEDYVAFGWLMIHGANCWGYDKCPLEDRIDWVEERLDWVRSIAEDPMTHTDWHEADKPFQFLAWAFDFIGVLDRGEPSYIRVAMDGSCNGIQHFAAMLRDPVAARAVNLADTDKPNDIYQEVADVVTAKLKKIKGKDKWIASSWLQLGIDRKMTKRSVMVMPYGGTKHSTMKYVEQEFNDRVAAKKIENPFGDEKGPALSLLAALVHDATREVVTSGKLIMQWLQDTADVASKAGVHLKWTTPHGFVARQCYLKSTAVRVNTYLDGKFVNETKLREETNKIDTQRSRNSISPNFVHSLDACALMMTINACVEEGVTHFHMIHDDYGTHAADTQLLADTLREQFVLMYENDVLQDFYEEVRRQVPRKYRHLIKLPPEKLGFDLDEVLRSDFFFA